MSYVAAVLVHVPDVVAGRSWYQKAFPGAIVVRSQSTDFEFLQIGQTQLEIVFADEKVTSGAAGSVVYWRVEGHRQLNELKAKHLLGSRDQ